MTGDGGRIAAPADLIVIHRASSYERIARRITSGSVGSAQDRQCCPGSLSQGNGGGPNVEHAFHQGVEPCKGSFTDA